MTTLRIVSSVDESTVLYDLNDPSGTYSGLYGSATTKLSTQFDIGSPTLKSTTVTPQDIDATFSAFSQRATATMKGSLYVAASSYDNLMLAVGTLSNYLTQGCVMNWVQGGNSYLIDVLPSETPALLNGQELAIYEAGALFQTKIPLTIERQPYLRMAGLNPAANIVPNPTLTRDSNGDTIPDSWVKNGTPTFAIDPTTQSLSVTTSSSSHGALCALGSGTATAGLVYTVSCAVAVSAGTFRLQINWADSGGSSTGTSTATFTNAQWARVSLTGTAPASTTKAEVALYANASVSTAFKVRNVQFEQASSASPFRVKAQTVNLDPAASGFAKMLPVYNPSTAPAPMTITTAFPDASTNVEAMDFWLATSDNNPGKGYLSDYLNGPYYAQAEANGNGWTLTAGTDTTLAGTADASASPGSGTTVARITHSTDPTTYNKRITFSRSTLLDCLRGSHRVFARVKPAAAKKYRLQLFWSAGTTTRETNDEFLIDSTLDTSIGYALCDLGTIELPESTSVTLNALTLELYTRMGAGYTASNLDVDYLMLVPQRNSAHVIATEAETSSFVSTDGQDLQVPKDLGAGDPTWTAGTVVHPYIKLNVLNQAAGIGSTTTGAWTGVAGVVHRVSYLITEVNFIGTYNLEVANVTDNTVTSTTAYARTTASNTALAYAVNISDTASKVYQPRVTLTAYTSGYIVVREINVWTVFAITQNQQIRTDPGSTGLNRYAAERLDSSSFYVGSLDADRAPFWIPPGLSLLWLESYDASTGGSELPHINARTLTVTPTIYPRFWG